LFVLFLVDCSAALCWLLLLRLAAAGRSYIFAAIIFVLLEFLILDLQGVGELGDEPGGGEDARVDLLVLEMLVQLR